MKKGTPIFFILLANLILLVHFVVPHHHHKNAVCIEKTHCQAASEEHPDGLPDKSHEHDGENGKDYCVLKQAVVVLSNQLRHDLKYSNCTNNPFPLDGFHAFLNSNHLIFLSPVVVSGTQIPSINSRIPRFSYPAVGLRAPPVV